MAEHKLINGTLVVTQDGVVAKCSCGWVSRPCFTSMTASCLFMDHQEGYEASLPDRILKEPQR